MLNYPLVASKAMMKVKGYWPQASTDEPQVLALAELLRDAKIAREEEVLAAVTALAKTESAKKNEFRPTPAMICDMTVSLRRDRYQQERGKVPTGVNADGSWFDHDTGQIAQEYDPLTGQLRPKTVASPERRDRLLAEIRSTLSGSPLAAEINIQQPASTEFEPDHDRPRNDLGGYNYGLLHAERLSTECRRTGVPDTEDELIQYRWTFEPPEDWKTQPVCGPWVNSQAQAMQEGKNWLTNANRRHR